MLLLVNLLFVLVFHHHLLSTRFLRDASVASATWTNPHTVPAPRPPCPACRIARTGAVQPSLGIPTGHRLAVSPLTDIRPAIIVPFAHPAVRHGRAPPLV